MDKYKVVETFLNVCSPAVLFVLMALEENVDLIL